MNPHELMREASHGHEPDLDRLTSLSRSRGTRLRRRRQGLSLGAAAASVVLIATAVAVAGQAGQAGRSLPVAGSPASSEPTPADPSPATPTPSMKKQPLQPTPAPVPGQGATDLDGRAVAAGLREAVAATEEGQAADFRGQGGSEAYAELTWRDEPDDGVSVIGINVQFFRYVVSCEDYSTRCERTNLPDGSVLVTYEERTPVADGVGLRWTAELNRADGVRISAMASNGFDLPNNRFDVTRDEPGLSFEQLKQIAQAPFWGRELPAELAQQGQDLPSYDDLDADITGSPTEAASPSPRG